MVVVPGSDVEGGLNRMNVSYAGTVGGYFWKTEFAGRQVEKEMGTL